MRGGGGASLQVYIQILLDICRENMENSHGELIDSYPMFKDMYQQIYDLCLDTERRMNMCSEELAILDRNTVLYMIEEAQDKIAQMDREIAKNDWKLAQMDRELAQKDRELARLKLWIAMSS